MVAVAFAAVTKRFDGDDALRSFTLDVDDGTICCLLGPSGSGKSTALRILAGLTDADDGEVRIGRRRVNDVPTRERDLGFVAQRDTLPSGRRAGESVALPLTFRARPVEEIDARIHADAEALTVSGLLDRPPEQLSTGERRVLQTARALVARPSVLLLDEPLVHLDAARRAQVRAELLTIQRRHGVTTLWATSDQAEAMAVSDRIAVLVGGRLAQVGAPMEVYRRPRTIDVARLLGEPEISLLPARLRGVPGDSWYELGEHRLRCRFPGASDLVGRALIVGIRAHDVADPGGATGDAAVFDGLVTAAEQLGRWSTVELLTSDGLVLRRSRAAADLRSGDHHTVALDPARFHVFDAAAGTALHHPE